MPEFYTLPDMLNRYVEAVERGDVAHSGALERKMERGEDKFHASDTNKCHRMRIFKRIHAPKEPNNPVSLRRFMLGNMVESVVRQAVDWCIRSQADYKGFRVAFQFPASHPQWEAHGTGDMLLAHPDNTGILWDIKSCHSWKIDYVKKGEKDASYLGQITFYRTGVDPAVLKELGLEKIHRAGIVYIDKDTMVTHPDWAPDGYEQTIAEDYGTLMKEWKEYQHSRIVPRELPFVQGKKKGAGMVPYWLCDPRYCQFYKNCPTIKNYWASHGEENS